MPLFKMFYLIKDTRFVVLDTNNVFSLNNNIQLQGVLTWSCLCCWALRWKISIQQDWALQCTVGCWAHLGEVPSILLCKVLPADHGPDWKLDQTLPEQTDKGFIISVQKVQQALNIPCIIRILIWIETVEEFSWYWVFVGSRVRI